MSYPEYTLEHDCWGRATSSTCLVSLAWIVYVSELVIHAGQIPVGVFVYNLLFKTIVMSCFFLPWKGSYFICGSKINSYVNQGLDQASLNCTDTTSTR